MILFQRILLLKREGNVLKNYDQTVVTNKADIKQKLQFSRNQWLVLCCALLLSFLIVLIGYSIHKLQNIQASVENIGILDILKGQEGLAILKIQNPTFIPLNIEPFILNVKSSDNSIIALLMSRNAFMLRAFSTEEIPLNITIEPDFKPTDIINIAFSGVVIEGSITVKAFGIEQKQTIRKKYAVSQLLKNN